MNVEAPRYTYRENALVFTSQPEQVVKAAAVLRRARTAELPTNHGKK